MLSNSSPIANRRQHHRRQNSTPTAFEAPSVRPIPAAIHNQRKPPGHRRGMSLDQRPTFHGQYPDFQGPRAPGPGPGPPFSQDDISVSIGTNPGQYQQQHPMQVAQQHRPAQPGQLQHQDHQQQQAAQRQYPAPQLHGHQGHRIPQQMQQSQPQTPQDQPHQPPLESLAIPNLGPQQPLHLSPTVQLSPPGGMQQQQPPPPPPPKAPGSGPSEQQLKELEEHIKSVYGSMGTVYVNILPSPVAAPQKGNSADNLDMPPLPSGSLNDMTDISLDPPAGSFAMSSQPGSSQGFDGSTCYSPSILSHRSPSSSPHQRHVQSFLEHVEEAPLHAAMPQLSYSDSAPLLSSPLMKNPSTSSYLSASPTHSSPRAMSVAELHIDGSIEDTGITAEEVSAYISPQDAATHRWTCLYPGCNKTFGRRENIRSHVQTHLGDRQFRCNHCGKCFVRQHDLKRHAKIHTGDKPYRCPCGGGFARQDALTRHRQRGMCIGGFPGVTRNAKARGRPRKKRPDMEDRMEKAVRSRRAAAATADYSSSVSGGSVSDGSVDGMSPFGGDGTQDFGTFDSAPLAELGDTQDSDPFGFDDHSSSSPINAGSSHSSPFEMLQGETQAGTSAADDDDTNRFELEFESGANADGDSLFDLTNTTSEDVAFDLSPRADVQRMAQTPPHSPVVRMPGSGSSDGANAAHVTVSTTQQPQQQQQDDKSPSWHSANSGASHAFTTPPTSPLCSTTAAEEALDVFTASASFGECDGGMDMPMSMFGDASAFNMTLGPGQDSTAARMEWFDSHF